MPAVNWSGSGSGGGGGSVVTDPTGTSLSVPSIMFDDFGWTTNAAPRGPFAWERYASGAGATHASVAPLSSELNRVGIHQVTPSTSASFAGGFYSNSNLQVYPGGMALTFAYSVQVAKIADGTDDWVFIGGYQDFVGVLPTNGIFFVFDRSINGNWQTRTRAASTNTTKDTGIAVTTGWTNFRIEVNAAWTSVSFYINGVLATAAHTTNIPSAATVSPQIYMYRVAGSAGTTNFKIDWAYWAYTLGSARGTF